MEEHPTRLQRIRALSGKTASAGVRAREGAPEPEMPLAVVEWLESQCPNVAPPPDLGHLEMVIRAAQVDVVQRCRELYERQKASRENLARSISER